MVDKASHQTQTPLKKILPERCKELEVLDYTPDYRHDSGSYLINRLVKMT